MAVCFSCRLLHFEVVDAAGELQPLDRMELIKEPLKLTGGQKFQSTARQRSGLGCVLYLSPQPDLDCPWGIVALCINRQVLGCVCLALDRMELIKEPLKLTGEPWCNSTTASPG